MTKQTCLRKADALAADATGGGVVPQSEMLRRWDAALRREAQVYVKTTVTHAKLAPDDGIIEKVVDGQVEARHVYAKGDYLVIGSRGGEYPMNRRGRGGEAAVVPFPPPPAAWNEVCACGRSASATSSSAARSVATASAAWPSRNWASPRWRRAAPAARAPPATSSMRSPAESASSACRDDMAHIRVGLFSHSLGT